MIFLDAISEVEKKSDFFETFYVLFFFFFTWLIAYWIYKCEKKVIDESEKNVEKYNLKTQEDIDKIDKSIIIKDIVQQAFLLLRDSDLCRNNYDYDKLKELVSSGLFTKYKNHLEGVKDNNLREHVKNISLEGGGITDIREVFGLREIDLMVDVSKIEYVEDSTGRVVKGDKTRRKRVKYRVTLFSDIDLSHITNCPSCGSTKIDLEKNKCLVCDSYIETEKRKYVIKNKHSMQEWYE